MGGNSADEAIENSIFTTAEGILSLQTLKKLSLIGMGRMGRSMVGGWLNSGLSANKIQIIDPNISINDDFITENDLSMKSLEEIDLAQGTIVIAVKPQVVENILITLREKLTSETTIISIVAGYSTKDIRNYIGMAPKLIRAMPNTPAAIGKGMTAIFSDSALEPKYKIRSRGSVQRHWKVLLDRRRRSYASNNCCIW